MAEKNEQGVNKGYGAMLVIAVVTGVLLGMTLVQDIARDIVEDVAQDIVVKCCKTESAAAGPTNCNASAEAQKPPVLIDTEVERPVPQPSSDEGGGQ